MNLSSTQKFCLSPFCKTLSPPKIPLMTIFSSNLTMKKLFKKDHFKYDIWQPVTLPKKFFFKSSIGFFLPPLVLPNTDPTDVEITSVSGLHKQKDIKVVGIFGEDGFPLYMLLKFSIYKVRHFYKGNIFTRKNTWK